MSKEDVMNITEEDSLSQQNELTDASCFSRVKKHSGLHHVDLVLRVVERH